LGEQLSEDIPHTFKHLTYHVIALRCDKNKHKKGEENANGAPENGEGEIRQECCVESRDEKVN